MASGPGLPDSNQFSSSSEDLLNLLCELERGSTNLLGLSDGQQLDEDEKVKIENIRKQLMSCEVQSPDLLQQHQQNHQQQQQQQLSQQLPQQIPPQQQLPQQQQQQHQTTPQHVNLQSNSMYIVNTSSPSPSWQQQQQAQQPMSPYSPQQQSHNTNPRSTPTSQRLLPNVIHTQQQQSPQQHPPMQLPTAETSPQLQQMQQQQQQHRSPSQSVSPPATKSNNSTTLASNEPSPVVKKNPLLNAQLVNTRPTCITPTRFMSQVQTSVLHQNPILNAKLSQGSHPITGNVGDTSCNVGGVVSPVNPQLSLSPQPRYIQQQTQPQQNSNFNFDISRQPQNAQTHTPQHINHYAPGDRQQQSAGNQVFRTTNLTSGICSPDSVSLGMRDTISPTVGLSSQQVKQEIRRKVQQQPKQQHQPTSLLKQLLSDDNR